MGDRFKAAFLRFRRGGGFLAVLAGALALVAMAHFVFGFDPDWSVTNLALSTEASVASCLLLDILLKQADADRALLLELRALVARVEEETEEIAGDLHDLTQGKEQ